MSNRLKKLCGIEFFSPVLKAERSVIIVSLIIALAIRLYLLNHYYIINNDGILYIQAARNYWEGNYLSGLNSFYPPFYPLMIAFMFSILGDWEFSGQFWPLFLSLLLIFPLYGLFVRVYDKRIASVAILFYSISPYLARLSVHVRSEIPYIFFIIIALYYLQLGLDRRRPFPFFIAGVSSGFAYLIRSEGIGFVIVGVVILLYRGWLKQYLLHHRNDICILLIGFSILSIPYVSYLKWDTGRWLLSRKASFIVSLGLSEYDPTVKPVGMEKSDSTSFVKLVKSDPKLYARKVLIDIPRSLVLYLEAVHYTYLFFLFVGWYYFFRFHFWKKEDFKLFFFIIFYLFLFALIYVNRRYAVSLVPLSMGWVANGYLAITHYIRSRSRTLSAANWVSIVLLVFFIASTLPKTLKSIGHDKHYLRQAGLYLKSKKMSPLIYTSDGRVAFYARGNNQIKIVGTENLKSSPFLLRADYLALDRSIIDNYKLSLSDKLWRLDRKFLNDNGNALYIFGRV